MTISWVFYLDLSEVKFNKKIMLLRHFIGRHLIVSMKCPSMKCPDTKIIMFQL